VGSSSTQHAYNNNLLYIYFATCFRRRGHVQAFSTFTVFFLLNLFVGQCLYNAYCQTVLSGLNLSSCDKTENKIDIGYVTAMHMRKNDINKIIYKK
jgi:hypothetical protein